MKSQGIAVRLRIVFVIAALALPAASLPQAASAGWTWDENTVPAPAADAAGGDGWTWDETAVPGDESGGDGWTWDEESSSTGSDPSAVAAAPEPAADQPAP